MALDKFGIKEVADVRFYEVGAIKVDETTGDVKPATGETLPEPTLELDTLKVSTIEFTAEQSEARGGKGNAPLIIWDYGREVNVTLGGNGVAIIVLAMVACTAIIIASIALVYVNKYSYRPWWMI